MFYLEKKLSAVSLTMAAVVVVSTLLIGPALTSSLRLALAASDTSQQCKDSADKISSKADASQSG